MYSKRHELEAIIEDLIENTITDTFADSFSSSIECEAALNILITKLEELDIKIFKQMFD
jgi:hypothetical protein